MSDYTRKIKAEPPVQEMYEGGAAVGDWSGDGAEGIQVNNDRADERESLPDLLDNRLDNPEGWLYSIDGVDNVNGDVALIAGAGITIVPDNVLKTITIAATGGGGAYPRHLFFPPESFDARHGDYGSRSLGGTGICSFSLKVPAWVTSIDEVNVWCIPVGTNAAANIDLTSNYAAEGEQYTNHAESDLTSTYNLVAGQLTKIPIKSLVFTGLAAGDAGGVSFDMKSVGSTTHMLYLELVVQ